MGLLQDVCHIKDEIFFFDQEYIKELCFLAGKFRLLSRETHLPTDTPCATTFESSEEKLAVCVEWSWKMVEIGKTESL